LTGLGGLANGAGMAHWHGLGFDGGQFLVPAGVFLEDSEFGWSIPAPRDILGALMVGVRGTRVDEVDADVGVGEAVVNEADDLAEQLVGLED